MNKINENDILETTLSIAENEYSEAYRSFMGIRRTVHRQEQIWNRSLEKTASGKFHGKGTKPGLSQNLPAAAFLRRRAECHIQPCLYEVKEQRPDQRSICCFYSRA